jgi:hypothetical protein
MKKIMMIMIKVIFASCILHAQVAINDDGSSPESSAMLEVKSTSKGFLPPRMTESERDLISSPVSGLIIYQTDENAGLYRYTGTGWEAVNAQYSVGDYAFGGVVFWVDDDGEHGLVCAIEDLSSGKNWTLSNYHTYVSYDGIYAGEMNTTIIISLEATENHNSTTCASGACRLYSDGTYSDWYLPSKAELNLMYQNKATINATATANGGSDFTTNPYWSSTEYDENAACYQIFSTGSQSYTNKSSGLLVRPIRSF